MRPSSDQPRKSRGRRHGALQGYRRGKDRPRGLVEIRRPPHNYFDVALIRKLATALETLDADPGCRALVLAAQGKAFCAGANFGDDDRDGSALLGGPTPGTAHLNIEGNRLFRTKKPIVAAVHGAAVGGGLGLAMVADFRVTCAEARFSANFTRLGFHPGFGLTVTLPAAVSPATKLSPWVLPIC